jgi:hypothetical protein
MLVLSGIAIAAANYSLVPSLTFLSILLASAMAYGNLFLVTLAAFTSLTASLLGGLVFGFDMAPYASTPAESDRCSHCRLCLLCRPFCILYPGAIAQSDSRPRVRFLNNRNKLFSSPAS